MNSRLTLTPLGPGCWLRLAAVVLCALAHHSLAGAEPLAVEELRLPALRINGVLARAHTQGIEVVANDYYVTARRDDLRPRQALLLRTAPGRNDWDVWNITPTNSPAAEAGTIMDHPGGMQSDGKRLWIPVAESRPRGRALVRAFPLAGLQPGKPALAESEFVVPDHIGSVAASKDGRELLGASWDTETVYVWDSRGRLQQTWTKADLGNRLPGVGLDRAYGVAVQDWKIVNDRLYASGLMSAADSPPGTPRSRWLVIHRSAKTNAVMQSFLLESKPDVELAREGMSISGDFVHFLPEDLGASNRLFRVRLADLVGRLKPNAIR